MKQAFSWLGWCAVLLLIGPLVWAVAGSLVNEAALFGGAKLSVSLAHYRSILLEREFYRPLLNSLVVSTTTTLLCVTLASLAAYSLSRLRFFGRRLLAGLFLVVAMFPQISIVSPLYMLLKWLGLIDTTPGLVLPYLTFAMPLAVWLLISHFKQLPRGVEEAALLDGASRLVVLKDIVIPMALPGIFSTAIVTFIYCWNEFLFALSFTIGKGQRTAPVAIALFRGQYQIPWGEILAGTVLCALPVALLFLVFQKRIVRSFGA